MNTLNTITASIISALNSDTQVSALRDEAEQRIGAREVARSYMSTNLTELPELMTGFTMIEYKDARGEDQAKSELKNELIWLVTLTTTIETGFTSVTLLASILQHWAKEPLNVDWTLDIAVLVATKYHAAMTALDIISTELTTNGKGTANEYDVNMLSDEFKAYMGYEAEALRKSASMVCRPLDNQPMDWTSNVDGVGIDANMQLIRGKVAKGDAIDQRVLDAVNKLQAVAFRVSPAIIDAAHDCIDNGVGTAEEMRMYRDIIKYADKDLYFPVTMDKRGRMYYRGGLLTPQGTDFCKAAFQFAEAMPLGKTGLQAIAIHTANALGHDKVSLAERQQIITSYIDSGSFDNIADHFDVEANFPGADTFQALVAIKELQRLLAIGGNPANLTSALVCHQDGTCNGLQHMAAITHDLETATTVNCTASSIMDTPSDIYGLVAADAALNSDAALAALINKYGRGMAKNAVMITGYGAGEETVCKNVAKYLAEKGEDFTQGLAIGEAYLEAIARIAGAVNKLTGALKGRVAAFLEAGGEKVTWTTADGFVASTHYTDREQNRVRAGNFNVTVDRGTTCPLDDVKTLGAMSPNFVHSIDAAHLRMVVNACNHSLVTVHDSIGSHAGTYFATAKAIREQFVEVHVYDALGSLCDSLGVRAPRFKGEYNAVQALKSSYIFS